MIDKYKNEGISIVIPTYGKLNFLKEVLLSLNNQIIQNFKVEILIVYQNRDDVKKIVKTIKFKKIRVVLIHNKKLGSTRARNTGTIKAKYSLIAYIDDDIVPIGNNWLKTIWILFQKHDIKILCGQIILDSQFPTWMNKYRVLFVDFNKGKRNKFLELGSFVPSAQLIVTKSLMIKLGGFRLNLDRVGTNLLSGCDNELSITFGRINQRVFYSPTLKVMHNILPYRTKFSYMFKRLFWQGVTDIYVDSHFYKIGKRKIIRCLISYVFFILKKFINLATYKKIEMNYLNSFAYKTGYIYGLFFSLIKAKPKARPLNIFEQV